MFSLTSPKILIGIRLGIGDVILSTPVIQALRRRFPDAYITVEVSPNAREAIEGLPFIDQVITYQKEIDSTWSIIKKIRGNDVLIALDQRYRTAVHAFLARIPIRTGLRTTRGFFLTHPVEENQEAENMYQTDYFADIIHRGLGIKLEIDNKDITVARPTDEHKRRVDKLFAAGGLTIDKPYVAISPFTSWDMKDWPIENFMAIIAFIREKGLETVLLGDSGAKKDTFYLGESLNLMGKTALCETAYIIENAQLLISGCGMPIHMAAALGKQVISLHGPTSVKRWAPRGKCTPFSVNLTCGPCLGKQVECLDNQCMKRISDEQVIDAIRQILQI